MKEDTPNLKFRNDLKRTTIKAVAAGAGLIFLGNIAGAFQVQNPTATTNNAAGTGGGGGGGGTAIISPTLIGTQYSITVQTPTAGTLAWATDTSQFLIYNGSNWYIDSSYLMLQVNNYDMGYQQYSNHAGYGLTYVTDKEIANCTIGYGSLNGIEGQIRQNPIAHLFQVYQNGSWQTLVANFNFSEYQGAILSDMPVNHLSQIRVYSGNSTMLGLNGQPLVHNYNVDMGAYPYPTVLNGGSF